jgi:hypothetical protein
MNYDIGIYDSLVDFFDKNLNYNFYIRKYDYKIGEYRFKTHDEIKEHIENTRKCKYYKVIYCRGKNNNYLIEHYQDYDYYSYFSNNCFVISYVYEKPELDKMKKSSRFFFPETEDFDLFDKVVEIESRVNKTLSEIIEEVNTTVNTCGIETGQFKEFALTYNNHPLFWLLMMKFKGQEPAYAKYFLNNHLHEYSRECI